MENIQDKLVKVCLCKGISKFTIKECINEGCKTIDEISKKTGATNGSCKGNRCKAKIQELIDESK